MKKKKNLYWFNFVKKSLDNQINFFHLEIVKNSGENLSFCHCLTRKIQEKYFHAEFQFNFLN